MNSRDRAIERVRKLLGLAQGDGAHDGEIKNAMNAATTMIAEFQIEQWELEQKSEAEQEVVYGHEQYVVGKRDVIWINMLTVAIRDAVGTVVVANQKKKVKTGVFGAEELMRCFTFYGPEADVKWALELMQEWISTISAIAVGRYGSCLQGDGRAYCMGFAGGLQDIASELYKPKPGSGTDIVAVAESLAIKRSGARDYMEQQTGFRSGRQGTVKSVGTNAYRDGQRDARSAGFGASRTKALGNRPAIGGGK